MASMKVKDDWRQAWNKKNRNKRCGVSTDFKIILPKQTFPVDKIVLSTTSEYFRAMLESKMKECEQGYCELNCKRPIIALQCISFMYTEKMTLESKTVVGVLKLSHHWLLDKAVEACENFLMKNVTRQVCVEWLNLANMYELSKLRKECIKVISENVCSLSNLDELHSDVLECLLKKAKEVSEKSKLSWILLQNRIKRNTKDSESPCKLVENFPVENLTDFEFQEIVLQDNHVASCASCGAHVVNRRHIKCFRANDLTNENCLKIMEMAKKYEADRLLQDIERFIIMKFGVVSKNKDFVHLVPASDLLKYTEGIRRSCTKEEFKVIIAWLKKSEDRLPVFAKLFSSTGKFLKSLSHLRECHTHPLYGLETFRGWLVSSDNCCFVRRHAENYSCKNTIRCADEFILENFSSVATNPDIANLPAKAMISYMTGPQFHHSKHPSVIWTAITNWAQHGDNNSDEDFQQMLNIMLKNDDISTSLLQEMSKNSLVQKSSVCAAQLLDVVFRKFSEIESKQAAYRSRLEERLKAIHERMWSIEVQSINYRRENSMRLAVLERLAIIEAYKKFQDLERRGTARSRELRVSIAIVLFLIALVSAAAYIGFEFCDEGQQKALIGAVVCGLLLLAFAAYNTPLPSQQSYSPVQEFVPNRW